MKTTDVFHVSLPLDESAFSEWEEEIRTLLVMAEAYRWGNGEVEPDAVMAMEYYREAAELGDWEAMGLLADMLEEAGNSLEAEEWYARIKKKAQYK